MTPQQRLTLALGYIAELRTLAEALPDHHELAVLAIHEKALRTVDGDTWFLNRLHRGGLLTDLIAGLLDLYTPDPANPQQQAPTLQEI